MTMRRIAEYLEHILLKREPNLAEQSLIGTACLFFPEKVKKLKESWSEFLLNRRVAIRCVSDSGHNLYTRLQDGDYWVKYELIKAFGEMGCTVTDVQPDIIINLVGAPTKLPKSAFKIAWIYSHPDTINEDVLRQYDKIFCLSSAFIPKINQMGFEAELMIGATAKLPVQSKINYDVVFVGNLRGVQGGRRIVQDMGQTPYNFKVWGKGWENILPERYYGGPYFDNQRLDELYCSSLITLNDHHEDMSREGFVAVRVFDILASGGFCISDKNSGIEEIFGDSVPQYESAQHLRELIDFYINHPDERSRLMEEGREIARSHTWGQRVNQFLKGIEDLHHEGAKINLSKVLYVDTLSEATAQANISGMIRAYQKVSNLKTFDYRRLARKYGTFLMNRLLLRTAVRFGPELIHLGKSELIYGSTIEKIKREINTCVIHFYGDFRWEPQDWVVDIGKCADRTLFYHKEPSLIRQYEDLGVGNTGFWWVGTDPDIFYPRGGDKIYDLVFMASNPDSLEGCKLRRELVAAIAKEGIELHIFGNGWEHLSDVPNVHIHPFVAEEEFAQVCSRAKISLSTGGLGADNDAYMYNSWRRPFNSMACGVFHLTSYFPGLEEVFENGKHLVWFESISEAIELIECYLAGNDEREQIARTGRQEVISHHTWDHRIAQMFKYMKEVQSRQ